MKIKDEEQSKNKYIDGKDNAVSSSVLLSFVVRHKKNRGKMKRYSLHTARKVGLAAINLIKILPFIVALAAFAIFLPKYLLQAWWFLIFIAFVIWDYSTYAIAISTGPSYIKVDFFWGSKNISINSVSYYKEIISGYQARFSSIYLLKIGIWPIRFNLRAPYTAADGEVFDFPKFFEKNKIRKKNFNE
jgi:hypothetical protein